MKQVLDPLARFSEAAFGLVMVLGFTGSFSAATAGAEDVQVLLVGAIGCNIAWGIVDAMMFVVGSLAERGRAYLLLRSVHGDPAVARAVMAEVLPQPVIAVLTPEEIDDLRGRIAAQPLPTGYTLLRIEDLQGALGVFLIVFLSTLPVVIPFAVFDETLDAMRISNAIAVTLLFGCGWTLGRYAGFRPWLTGGSMVAIGGALVAITIALGG